MFVLWILGNKYTISAKDARRLSVEDNLLEAIRQDPPDQIIFNGSETFHLWSMLRTYWLGGVGLAAIGVEVQPLAEEGWRQGIAVVSPQYIDDLLRPMQDGRRSTQAYERWRVEKAMNALLGRNPQPDFSSLSSEDTEILMALARGEKNKQVAQRLNFTPSAISKRLAAIAARYQKTPRQLITAFAAQHYLYFCGLYSWILEGYYSAIDPTSDQPVKTLDWL